MERGRHAGSDPWVTAYASVLVLTAGLVLAAELAVLFFWARHGVCERYERGGLVDCGGSPGFREASSRALWTWLLLVLVQVLVVVVVVVARWRGRRRSGRKLMVDG